MTTFLFGRPGSGKTTYIIDEIKSSVEKRQRTYLLVPEQQVYTSECMLADLPASSALCFEVVSFSRLCQLVFAKFGGLTDSPASSGVRHLVMWQSLRELSGSLSQYKSVKADSQLTSMMLSAIDELKANSITPEMCEDAADRCDNKILSEKLGDIAAIYTAFSANISNRVGEFAIAAETKLPRLISLLSEHNFFDGARVFIDSFTSFTAEEFKVIEQIMRQADDTCISFTYERGCREPHTETLENTVKKLTRFAKDEHIEYRDVTLTDISDSKAVEIDMLGRCLWDFSVTKSNAPEIPEKDRGHIEMYSCQNEYEETWLAALNILKAHRGGVKYSEMALIMRDCESKKGIVEAVFEQMGIPYFYSEKTDLSSTAVARLVSSALRCISHNFSLSDVMTLLKTGLLGVDAHDADLFEDYCYTWSINGKQFASDVWSMNPDGYTVDMSDRGREILESANKVRSIIIPPLLELKRNISIAKGDTVENCRAIYAYLEKIGLSENLSSMAELALISGNIKEAGETLRLYDFLVSSLTEICTVMSDTSTTAEELACAIEIMFKHTDIGSVPAVNDYVTVGEAATLRVENIKVALLLGLCDGEFPANYSDSGILCESDKAELDKLGLPLSSHEDNVISDELFFVYRSMTKPSDRLILSTHKSNISGKATNPSSAWNRALLIFPYITVKNFDLYRIKNIKAKEELNTDVAEDNGSVTTIDPLYVRMLFGDKLYLSQSKLSSYALCPYQYWSKYVLKLREQNVSDINYADSGTMIHYVLEKLLREIKRPDGSLESLDDTRVAALVDRFFCEYISGINCPLPPSIMHSFSRLRDMSFVMSRGVLDEFDNSDFRILAFEKNISSRGADSLKPIELKINELDNSPTVSLGGKVDRIDFYDGSDGKYVRVVDYKSGTHKYSYDKLSTGEDLQLPAYLFTATLEQNKGIFNSDREIIPASALYMFADESGGSMSLSRSGFILGEQEILRAASANMDKKVLAGISENDDGSIKGGAAVTRDDIKEINEILENTLVSTARSLYSGKISRTPSEKSCKYCPVSASCPVAFKER